VTGSPFCSALRHCTYIHPSIHKVLTVPTAVEARLSLLEHRRDWNKIVQETGKNPFPLPASITPGAIPTPSLLYPLLPDELIPAP
jgi:hypothetical protein